jgi:hypothetical protein
MYLLLTGQTPPDALERASALLGGRPDPLRPIMQLNPAVPPAVAQALHIALSQMPEHRWVSAAAMRNALREAGKSGATMAQGPAATVPIGYTVPASNPSSFPPPAPHPQAPPTSAPTLPAQGAPFQTAQGLFNVPPPSAWAQAPGPPAPAYAAAPSEPARRPRTLRWTLFGVWLVVGLFVSLIGAAVIAVAAFGEDPPTQVTTALTVLLYLAGVVGLLIWAKL